MRLAISTHRPFNQLADQTVLGNLEANDFDPATSANFSIPTKFAHIRNKIGLVNPLTTILSQVIAIARREIIRRAAVTVVENEITVKNELFIALMIQRHRRRGDRQKQRWLVRLIHQPM